jgi:replicative DNA helicase
MIGQVATSVNGQHAGAIDPDRPPPHSIEAEEEMLRSVVRAPEHLAAVRGIVSPADLYDPEHRAAYEVIIDLRERGLELTPGAIHYHLERAPGIDGERATCLVGLIADYPAGGGANAEYFAHIVRDKAVRRAMVETALALARGAYRDDQSAAELARDHRAMAEAIGDLARPGADFLGGIVGARAFASTDYRREFLVDQILTRTEPCIVGGPRKSLKTSLILELAIALASGRPFLGQFPVRRPAKVLFLSGESGAAALQETLRRVCQARGIDPDDLDGRLSLGFNLPRLSCPDDLDALARFVRDHGIEVVIIDPLYLCLFDSSNRLDPANLFDVGPMLKRISDACTSAGATPILIHHLRKNRDRPDDPPELEDLAFAGVQEFARQWILIGRRERYEPGTGDHRLWLTVGGSAGHSGNWAVDIAEGTVDDHFAGRRWEVMISGATQARQEARQQADAARLDRRADLDRALDRREEKRRADDAERAIEVLAGLAAERRTKARWEAALAAAGWRSARKRLEAAIAVLEGQGRIRETTVRIPCNGGSRPATAYEPTPADEPTPGPAAHAFYEPPADEPAGAVDPGNPGELREMGSPEESREEMDKGEHPGAEGTPRKHPADTPAPGCRNEGGCNTAHSGSSEGGVPRVRGVTPSEGRSAQQRPRRQERRRGVAPPGPRRPTPEELRAIQGRLHAPAWRAKLRAAGGPDRFEEAL